MFNEERLPVGTQTPAPVKEPSKEEKKPKEIVIFADIPEGCLRIKPEGTLEFDVCNEIGFINAMMGARDATMRAAAICEKHGWKAVDSWLGAVNGRDKILHIKMTKEMPVS
jgi:hypothetical protein